MDGVEIALGRALAQRGLVELEALRAAARAVQEAAARGERLPLVDALVRGGALTEQQKAWVLQTVLPSVVPAAPPPVDVRLSGMFQAPAAALEEAATPAPPPAPAPAPVAPPSPAPAPAPTAAPTPDEARAAAVAKAKKGRSGRLSSSSSSTRLLRAMSADPPPRVKAGRRAVLLAGGLLLAAGAVAIVASRRAGGGPGMTDGPRSFGELQARVDGLARDGKYDEALAALKGAAPAVRATATTAWLDSRAAALERHKAMHAGLEAALGGPRPALEALGVKVARGERPDLLGLPSLDAWKARAREVVGPDRWDDLVLFGVEEEEPRRRPRRDDDEDEAPTIPTAAWASGTAPVGTSDPARRAKLEKRTHDGLKRVEEAKERLAERRAAQAEQARAEAARALADPRPLLLPSHGGRPGGVGKLLAWDQDGVVVEGGGARRRVLWDDAPPALLADLLERGVDPEDPDGQVRAALAAACAGQLDRARARLAKAKALDADVAAPPLASLEPHARVLHAAGTVTSEGVDVRYALDGDGADLKRDLEGGWLASARVKGGALLLAPALADLAPRAPAWTVHAAWFQDVTVELRATQAKGELLLGVGDVVVALGERGVGWGQGSPAPTRKGTVDWTAPLVLRAAPLGPRQARVVLRQGPARLLDIVAEVRWPATFKLGVQAGRARITELRVRGRPDPDWLKRAQDRVPFDVEAAIDEWRDAQAREALRDALPITWEPTTVEEAGSAAARSLVEQARTRVRRFGLHADVEELLRKAVSQGGARCWAAELLLAQHEVDEAGRRHAANLDGPRLRLDQAIAAVDGFPEALALRAEVHLHDGRLEQARADAEAAVALLPDHAPSRLALARVELQSGRGPQAVEQARLAAELAGGRPDWERRAREVEATVRGPPWSDPARREDPAFVLETDQRDRADELLAALLGAREAAPALFPSLRPREGARPRQGRVLLFARAEDYYRHAWRTGGHRMEHTAGYFSPTTGQLMVFESRDGPAATLRTVRHEATHQWCHSLGLELPYWANEAIADYVGGWDAAAGRSLPDAADTRALVDPEAKLVPLFDLMTMSPSEFYAGDAFTKYAQAWSFVHYCLEGGDARARAALLAYLEKHAEGVAGDRSRRQGSRLDYIYAETFHQLDMKLVEKRWWNHVRKLALEAERLAAAAKR